MTGVKITSGVATLVQAIVEIEGNHYVVGLGPEAKRMIPALIASLSPEQKLQLIAIEDLGLTMGTATRQPPETVDASEDS